MADITILGAGAWALALGKLLNTNGHNVTIWTAVENEYKMLSENRENTVSLPGIKIDENIHITMDIRQCVNDRDIIIMAVASKFVRMTANKIKDLIKDGQIIVNVSKGIEEATLMTLSQVIEDELPSTKTVVLSGPSHAEEVARQLPTTCVVGAVDYATAEYVQNVFMSNVFRVYTSPDMLGIEIGASLKNVIALAAGMADGIGCGDNTKAALITRGLAEITRLGVAMGANSDTFSGLSGMGDLIVTCASMHSRNRRAGILIGQGATMEEAMSQVKQIVEGVYSARAGLLLAKKYNVSMPIVEQVNEVLFNNKSVKEALTELMVRNKTSEIHVEGWNI